jgi:hypothetical protein
MSWASERVKTKETLDRFCGNSMTYEFIPDFGYDGNIYNSKKKFIGIAKIFSNAGNFGSNPIVEISKDDADFVYELGLLTAKKPALIVRFRNKIAYLRLEHTNYGIGEVRKKPTYKIPIGQLTICA